MLKSLLVFDIDGTLVRGGGAARAALAEAIRACHGVEPDLGVLALAGRTDQWIIREIVRANGLAGDPPSLTVLRDRFLALFAEAVIRQPGELCPGVRPLLDRLSARPEMALALGTGNLERSARLKLAAHGLDGYFPTGGFGDDAVERDAIIAAGIARARARHGGSGFDRIVVIGDTPFDVASARANRAHSVCVTTGLYGADALREAGATVIFPDLADTDAVVGAIEALPAGGHAAFT